MYIVHSTFEIPAMDKVEEVIQIYKNRSRSVDKAEGFFAISAIAKSKETKLFNCTINLRHEGELYEMGNK
ncbi:heme-degrading monooxygenase HmoA [Bacillus luteolus]|nr:heme-degrading monooxygenase HmoA [Cytobacillus luteolus]